MYQINITRSGPIKDIPTTSLVGAVRATPATINAPIEVCVQCSNYKPDIQITACVV